LFDGDFIEKFGFVVRRCCGFGGSFGVKFGGEFGG
jgi:hypothetical protein